MNRIIIASGALLLAMAVLLKISTIPSGNNTASPLQVESTFSSITSPQDALSQLAEEYPFLREDSLEGKTLAITIWSTDSPQSLEAIPFINKLANKYKNNNRVVFIALTEENREFVESYLEKNKIDFQYKKVYDGVQAKEYLTHSNTHEVLPINIIVNPAGAVIYYEDGASAKKLQQLSSYLESQLLR